jgi:hypothetical protein
MARTVRSWSVAAGNATLLAFACILLYTVTVGAEARRVGLIYTWRNELNTDVFTQEMIQATVPDTNTPVRGFIFLGSHGGCPGADNRPWARGEGDGAAYLQFARQFGFGLMATSQMCGTEYNMKNTTLLLRALDEMAAAGPNTEIRNVPLILFGASNAGATGYTLLNTMPGKILCSFLDVTASFNPTTPTDQAIRVPAMFSTGELDGSRNNHNTIIGGARARGAIWSWFEVKGMAHEMRRVSHIARPFWEKCIALRYPANYNPRTDGAVVLNPVAESAGWLVSSDWRTANPTVATFASYSGTKSTAQWVLDQDIAYMFRGIVTWYTEPTLDLEVDGALAAWTIPGDPFTIVQAGQQGILRVTPGAFAWNRIEFFRGATKLGEVTSGNPEYTFTLGTQSVAQTFTAAVYSASATRYPSPINVAVIGTQTGVRSAPAAAVQLRTGAAVAGAGTAVYDLNGRTVSSSGHAATPGLRFAVSASRVQRIVSSR